MPDLKSLFLSHFCRCFNCIQLLSLHCLETLFQSSDNCFECLILTIGARNEMVGKKQGL